MTIKELAKYCKSIDIDCERCEHKAECQKMSAHLEDISPCGVVQMIEENRDTQALWVSNVLYSSEKVEEFYSAWKFLENHKMFRGLFECGLWIGVVKVNPDTDAIDDDATKNTKPQVWLEHGPYDKECREHTHDFDLDCGGDTFEDAIIELARLVKKCYTDDGERICE